MGMPEVDESATEPPARYEMYSWCEKHRKMVLFRGWGRHRPDVLLRMAGQLGFAPERTMAMDELMSNLDSKSAPVLQVYDLTAGTCDHYQLPSGAALLWWQTTINMEIYASDCRFCHPELHKLIRDLAGGKAR